jgi:hypothetical protein
VRDVREFNLDDEVIYDASSPPPGLPSEFFVEEPPRWALRCIVGAHGTRSPKYIREVPVYAPTYGFAQDWVDGVWVDSSGARTPTERQHRKQREAKERQAGVLKQIPTGNLKGDDYRFFQGMAIPTGIRSNCRWCSVALWDKSERRHHNKKGETRCTEHMKTLFDFAVMQKVPVCFWCANPTTHRRWGFPLCLSYNCIYSWMFTAPSMAKGFMETRTRAFMDGAFAGIRKETLKP